MPDDGAAPDGPGQGDAGLTPRERRARRHRENAGAELSEKARRGIRRGAPLAAVLTVVGLAVGGLVLLSQSGPDCPDHWHASFGLFIDGRHVRFTHPEFLSPPRGSHDAHLHGDDGVLHYHPTPRRCVALDEMMGIVGVEPSDGRLVLAPTHGADGGTYEPSGNRTLRYFHQPYGQAWREVEWSDMRRDQLGNGDKWLMHYGPDALVAGEQAQVADLPPEYRPAA